MKEHTFCLMTCGEETEAECVSVIKGWLDHIVFQEVRNITPAYKALNQMFDQCETRFLTPLDADMILHADALERMREKIDVLQDDNKWHTILFPLWDTLTQEKIYALKIFNMDAMRSIPYKDDPCPDIQHFKDLTAAGLRSIDFYHEEPIGKHVVQGKFFCYAKYRDLYLTARSRPRDILENHFKGGRTLRERARLHHAFFVDRYKETGNEDYLYCIGGMLEGLTATLTYKSKNLGDREMVYEYYIGQGEPILSGAFNQWYETNRTHRVFV